MEISKLEKSKQISASDIKDKKAALEKEIERLENKYAKKSERVKKGFENTMKPIKRIRKNPFTAVSIAVLTGFIVGSVTGGSRKSYSREKRNSLTSMIGNELKNLAVRHTIGFVSEYVDSELIPRLKKNRSEKENKTD